MNRKSIQANIVFILRCPAPYWIHGLDAVAAAWQKYGEFHLVCEELKADPLHPWDTNYLKPQKAALHHCPPRKRWRGIPLPPREIWALLDSIDPQIVVIHEYSPYVAFSGLAWAKLRRRICLISSDVGQIKQKEFSRIHRVIQNGILRIADGMIARTVDAEHHARRLGKPVLLAPHAISTAQFEAKPRLDKEVKDGKRLIQVGALIPCKGVDLLLAALAKVAREIPDVELLLLGSGDQEGIRKVARPLGIENRLIFKEFLQPPEVAKEYAIADAFVLASRLDTYGVVVHEAAAAGLPLVVSKFAGASATLVKTGTNGHVADPFDTDAFSACLVDVLMPENNRKYGLASIQLAHRYDVDVLGQDTTAWMVSLLRDRSVNQGPSL